MCKHQDANTGPGILQQSECGAVENRDLVEDDDIHVVYLDPESVWIQIRRHNQQLSGPAEDHANTAPDKRRKDAYSNADRGPCGHTSLIPSIKRLICYMRELAICDRRNVMPPTGSTRPAENAGDSGIRDKVKDHHDHPNCPPREQPSAAPKEPATIQTNISSRSPTIRPGGDRTG